MNRVFAGIALLVIILGLSACASVQEKDGEPINQVVLVISSLPTEKAEKEALGEEPEAQSSKPEEAGMAEDISENPKTIASDEAPIDGNTVPLTAETMKTTPWWSKVSLNLFGVSHHPRSGHRKWNECERKKDPRKPGLNECNWGFGLRYRLSEDWFAEVNRLKNSMGFGAKVTTASIGVSHELFQIFGIAVRPAIAFTAAKYENPNPRKEDRFLVAPLPGLAFVGKKGVALSLVGVPSVNERKHLDGKFEVFTLYLNIPFGAIINNARLVRKDSPVGSTASYENGDRYALEFTLVEKEFGFAESVALRQSRRD